MNSCGLFAIFFVVNINTLIFGDVVAEAGINGTAGVNPQIVVVHGLNATVGANQTIIIHGQENASAVPVSLIGFGRIVLCATTRNPLNFNNYGCYCGWGGKGIPVDPIDACCKVHDECYGKCGERGCWPKLSPYDHTCNSETHSAICSSSNKPCEACACNCDANAAHCFRDNEQSYNPNARCP